MKLLIILAATFCASFALACPQLSGHFQCNFGNGAETTTITQEQRADGVTVYTINSMEVITDGIAHPYQDSRSSGTYTATCNAALLQVVSKGDLLDQGEKVGFLDIVISMLKNNTGLTIQMKGQLLHQGKSIAIDEFSKCTPL